MAQVLEETAHRLGDNYPYFHPLYAGQMLKPPHPVARAAYALAMKINPNNHALRRRPGQLGDGSGSGAGDRRDVRLDGVSGPPDLERDLCQPGSAVDGGAVGAGTADCGLGAGALHAPADFSGAEAGVCSVAGGRARADAPGRAGRRAAQRRRGHGGGDAGHDGDGRRGSARRDSGAERALWRSACMWMRRMAGTSG